VYEGDRLRYAGKVGSGFNAATRRMLRERLEALAAERPPFDPAPERKGDLRTARWIRPELVIRAELGGWTRDKLVRQTAYKGLDPDRDPKSVTREDAVDTRTAEAAAEAEIEREAEQMPTQRRTIVRDAADPTAARAKGSKGSSGSARGPETNPAEPPDPAWRAATAEELAALERMGREGTWAIGGQELKLTNLDKVLFPPHPTMPDDQPVTKRELVRYFARIGPAILPHLAERPLNLHRYPNGAGAPGFWQKDIPEHAPTWLRRWREVGVEAREANEHLIADQTATLCWLGNLAAFEIHAWTSRMEDPMRPTFALIDIDPGEKTTWEETLTLARLFRTALGHLKVRGYPKLTGKRGIQVWIPIVARYTYEDTSGWVEAVSRTVGKIVPDLVSWEWSVKERKGRARLDYTQNTYIKTLVAPYAVRPAPGAPVSAPITWDELDDPDLRPDRWTIRNVVERVEKLGDLFAPAQTDLQNLPALG
jgi:bifunctional non-homologous end joining protein LigD